MADRDTNQDASSEPDFNIGSEGRIITVTGMNDGFNPMTAKVENRNGGENDSDDGSIPRAPDVSHGDCVDHGTRGFNPAEGTVVFDPDKPSPQTESDSSDNNPPGSTD